MLSMNEREAFVAMALFLEEYFERTGGDFPTLIADIQIQDDGITADPAAWEDWLRLTAEVKRRGIDYDPSSWTDWLERNERARRKREGGHARES